MAAPIIRSEYDALTQIARVFNQQAEGTRRTLQKLQKQMAALQDGAWLGQGASAFYQEMHSQVMPTMQRLVSALETAERTTSQIRGILHQAEDDCARILRGQDAGGPASATAGSHIAGFGGTMVQSSGPGAGVAEAISGLFGGGATPAGLASGLVGPGDVRTFKAKAIAGFAAGTRPLPDPSGVIVYRGLPKAEGGYQMGAGWSSAVASWEATFKHEFPSIQTRRAQLDETKRVLEETMKEEGDALRAAAAKDIPKGLRELNKRTDGKAYELIKEYEHYGDMASATDRKAGAAEKRVDAALHKFEAAQSAVKQYELGLEQESWLLRRQDIEARIADRQEPISIMVDMGVAMATGQAVTKSVELGKDIAKEVIGGMTESEMAELMKIDSKIVALNQAIAKEVNKQVRAELQGAKAEMEAAFDEYVASKMEARVWEKAQWGTIDQLAALEQAHGTGHVFRELQQYNAQVRWVGDSLRAQTDGFLDILQSPPIAEGGKLAKMVEVDIQNVHAHGRDDPRWLDAVEGTKQYFEQLEQWRQAELGPHHQLHNDLAEGKHLSVVDEMMASADKSLGGTTYQGHLVR